MNNIKIENCPDHNTPIVKVRDIESEEGWMCMHCDSSKDDIHDVLELQKDPTGKTCNWRNPTLKRLQKENNNYQLESCFNLN